MNTITDAQITAYVEAHIGVFHDKRLESLNKLDLTDLLIKNPYLFRSKNLVIAGDLVKSLLDAYLSSQEETLFGEIVVSPLGVVSQRFYNAGVKIAVAGNQFPKILSTILKIIAFVRIGIPAVATSVNSDDVSSCVALPDDAGGSSKIVFHTGNLGTITPIRAGLD